MEIQLKGNKPDNVSRLIFDMLDVLFAVGVPTGGTHRRLERMAMACLAVGGIVDSFERAKSADDGFFLSTREIIAFENEHFDENISPGSYDDIRRKDLLLPVQAGIVVNSSAYNVQATNNSMRGYALNPKFTALLAEYGKPGWEAALSKYQSQVRSLRDELERKRKIERVAVTLPSGVLVELSAGEHNVLQKAIVEEFLPRFGFGAQVLYIGDTTDRSLYVDKAVLDKIGFFALEHEELPDVVAYSPSKNLVYLIEAVHSAGPMSEIRVRKLTQQLRDCTASVVFVTAFLTKKEFKRWLAEIAWETEVWLADSPDHMVHFNGSKFLELHK